MSNISIERSVPPRLTRVTLEGFRGFGEATSLDFDGSAVLIWGPNGTGKTSVFDGLQWLLLGDVTRLKNYTLRKNDEYLANTYRRGSPAVVEAEFRTSAGTVQARRIGDSRGSSLEVTRGGQRLVGTSAEVLLQETLVGGSLPLAEVVATSGLLQQDDLRQLLQTRPDQRYRQLLRLLGLEVLERFEAFAAGRRERARSQVRTTRSELDRLRAETESLSERIETASLSVPPGSEPPIKRLQSVLAPYADILALVGDLPAPEQLASFAGATGQLAPAIERHLEDLRRLPDELPSADASALNAATDGVSHRAAIYEAAQQAAAQARHAVVSASRSQDAIGRLAAAALPFLPQGAESLPCPVCETVIDVERVGAALRARAAGGAAVAAAEEVAAGAEQRTADAAAALSDAQATLRSLHEQSQQRITTLAALHRTISALSSVATTPSAPGLAINLASPLIQAPSRLAPNTGLEPEDDELFQDWLEERDAIIPRLRRLAEALGAVSEAARTLVSAQTGHRIATERAVALPRQRAQLDGLRQRVARQEAAYEMARRDETSATTLAQQATAATTEIFRDRFAALEPLMNDIYARLDPHPAFTQLDFRVETYRAKGTAVANVVDREARIEANPMLVFSSAQANAVVLATFLALSWAAQEKGLPFVLLDDPLQAFDDVNVLGFADVARRFRRHRQTVVATHEERFALLLERKLTGRAEDEDLVIHRFTGWSRQGPTIESRRIPPYESLRLAVLAS